jgi:tetratricopeptide (TPR) repeat protein
MKYQRLRKIGLIVSILLFSASIGFANDNLFKEGRAFQRAGNFDEAISAYKEYLTQSFDKNAMTDERLAFYTDALVQLMNTYQSKGEPEQCISALEDIFKLCPILQNECLRDYYSVLGYALSRTENMGIAEETTLKALTLPLHRATPERYFRDYAYAAAVFYSNPEYHKEVIGWCKEALVQAQSCKNTSGQQWVMSMLGSLYKRIGDLNGALELFQSSIEESLSKNDNLGVVNSLCSLVDLFLYWNIPEYANIYASNAIAVEQKMTQENPMVSAQVYINKGRALHQLGDIDSISFYLSRAREYCEKLPYNSGMVDVDLLSGICKTEIGGESLTSGMEELLQVTAKGTAANRAKAYHQLAQTYLRNEQKKQAGVALDSLYIILNHNEIPLQILHLDYESIVEFYRQKGNQARVDEFVEMMLQEQKAFKEKSLNYNLVESIINLQTENTSTEQLSVQDKQDNTLIWILIGIAIAAAVAIIVLFFFQRKKQGSLVEKLNRANDEKEKIVQEVKEFLTDKDNRQEMETLTPYVLKESGETKFRQHFELLYPLFLPHLREKVPNITRREELLSMLIVLKQDNKKIAELLSIEPRSVLMLRHRFRQKIGISTEYSLETFIEDLVADR